MNRLRGLLSNPRVTAALVVLAIVVTAWQILNATGFGTRSAVAEEPTWAMEDPPAADAEPVAGPPAPLRPVDTDALSWPEAPGREPFRFASADNGAARTRDLRSADTPKVSAVLIQRPGAKFAVVNGAVRGVGDAVAGYVVDRIESDRVALRPASGGPAIEVAVRARTFEQDDCTPHSGGGSVAQDSGSNANDAGGCADVDGLRDERSPHITRAVAEYHCTDCDSGGSVATGAPAVARARGAPPHLVADR